MRSGKVRLALVGFGGIAQKHLEVFRALGAEFVAACNRSAEGRKRSLTEGGIPRSYARLSEMVDRERPDGILVTTSVLSLFPVLRELIPFGRPILAEKPPGTSLAEARELAALAREHRVPVMVGLNRRFYSVYRRALERMGGTDTVTRAAVEWSEDPKQMLLLGHPPELLPLLNFANSLHGLDLLVFVAGSVRAPAVWGRNLDPSGRILRWRMSLEGASERGVRVRFDSTWDAPVRWRFVVEAPSVRFVSGPLESVRLSVRGRADEEIEPEAEDLRYKAGFFRQAEAFLEVVQSQAPVEWPACSLETSLLSMGLAEAVTRACKESSVERPSS